MPDFFQPIWTKTRAVTLYVNPRPLCTFDLESSHSFHMETRKQISRLCIQTKFTLLGACDLIIRPKVQLPKVTSTNLLCA